MWTFKGPPPWVDKRGLLADPLPPFLVHAVVECPLISTQIVLFSSKTTSENLIPYIVFVLIFISVDM